MKKKNYNQKRNILVKCLLGKKIELSELKKKLAEAQMIQPYAILPMSLYDHLKELHSEIEINQDNNLVLYI